MKLAELVQEDWGSSDWKPVMDAIKRAMTSGASLEDAAADEATNRYKDMGYEDADEAADSIVRMFKRRNNITEAKAKGMWVIKNRDGQPKRFKDDESPEAKVWAASSAAKKVKADQYSDEWWQNKRDKSDDDVIVPWDPIGFNDDPEPVLHDLYGKRSVSDWTWQGKSSKTVDGTTCTVRAVRVTITYDDKDDMGMEKGAEPVSDAEYVKVMRDRKNPKKLVFAGYGG